MAKHPGLIQRPIVVRGTRAVVARPVENIEKLLK
jgi:arsenate reductase-like glutaredoxin family protein